MEEAKGNMPVFVKIDEYKEILDVMDIIKNKLEQVKVTLRRIEDLKSKEDAEMVEWQKDIEEVEQKIANIDEQLFEPEGL